MRRLIGILPLVVIVAGAGIVGFYFFEQRNAEADRMLRENARIAKKTDVLPGVSDPADPDRQLAEAAFVSPEQVDSAPTFHYGKPQKMDNLYADPTVNSTSAVESIEYQPRPYVRQGSDVGSKIAEAPSSEGSAQSNPEHVNPESAAYQERVDRLMGMRQRRLQEKAGRNEK